MSGAPKGSNFARMMAAKRPVPEGIILPHERAAKAVKLNPNSPPRSSPRAADTKADLTKPSPQKASSGSSSRSLTRPSVELKGKDIPRSSKSREGSSGSDEINVRMPRHLSRIMDLLIRGVSSEEKKRSAGLSPLSLAEEAVSKSLSAAYLALELNDRVELHKGRVVISEDKCNSVQQRLKRSEKELADAKKHISDLEKLKVKAEDDLKKKNQELELAKEGVKKKDEVFSSAVENFENEITELRGALAQEREAVQSYKNSHEKLAAFADEQYTMGVEAATQAFKLKLPDADWSFLDQPMDDPPVTPAVGGEASNIAEPAATGLADPKSTSEPPVSDPPKSS